MEPPSDSIYRVALSNGFGALCAAKNRGRKFLPKPGEEGEGRGRDFTECK